MKKKKKNYNVCLTQNIYVKPRCQVYVQLCTKFQQKIVTIADIIPLRPGDVCNILNLQLRFYASLIVNLSVQNYIHFVVLMCT